MQIKLGPAVGKDEVQALANLPNLQACSFQSENACREALQAVSTLQGLTSVEVRFLVPA